MTYKRTRIFRNVLALLTLTCYCQPIAQCNARQAWPGIDPRHRQFHEDWHLGALVRKANKPHQVVRFRTNIEAVTMRPLVAL